ncbi:hypothetical protein S40288_08423 [Stachybotrys chartarum IBT 40288]|nr:hypothetical protein S40288_08423 [Stachybotrys chartarum IBT 40288]
MEHSLRDQWEQLIINPLSKISSHPDPLPCIFVIDALDECNNENDVRVILKIITTARQLTNIRLRIFITSRPETAIRHGLNKIPEMEREVFILHEISETLVNRDITLFFQTEFSAIRDERGFDVDWPGSRRIERLVEISSGLFIWAATACRFIAEGRRYSVVDRRISNLINGFSSGAGPEKQLNQIYATVLRDFAEQLGNDEQEKEEFYALLREVLGAIVIMCSPLPMKPLARLIDKPLTDVKDTLADLHTILQIPVQDTRPVNLHHPTFRDFLLNKERCVDLDFWVDEKVAHKALGDNCLALMSKMLRLNICDLESPGILAKDLEPSWVRRCIPPDLQYACLYWVEHYRRSGMRLCDGDHVDRFFRNHFLHWLEAINVMGKSAEQGSIIRLYHSLLQQKDNERQIPFVKDARRLIFNFQNIMKQAPLQVYCAALAFIPPTNELKSHFRKQRHPWIEDVRIAEADIPKAKDDFNYVSDLAFTPDSHRLASGSNFEAVRCWNVDTKAVIRKYEGGATDKMSAIAISPDGKILAGGSDDSTVMAWNIETGRLLYSIRAHTGWINSVAFSPNGKLLVTGSMDQTVALWDTNTGGEIKRIDNQSSSVNSVTISPDGFTLATASIDEVIRLWDMSKSVGETCMTLTDHSGPINSVRFSPSGKLIASGSDDMTIKIWNSATGAEPMTFKGHVRKVMTVAFSPNSHHVASGSEDKTVRIWDAYSGTALMTLTDHSSGINSVVFSPNGKLVAASSFDDEVRLWDTTTWTLIGKLDDFEEDVISGTLATQRPYDPVLNETVEYTEDLKGHTKAITCVVFSPNGLWLASGSQDATIKLWARNQEHLHLKGHSDSIDHLEFSPDSRMLASGSTDMTVRVWDTSTGASIFAFGGHIGRVLCSIFSPDGQLLGTASVDGTLGIWDMTTGATIGILDCHSSEVKGLAFSPDNSWIASWSKEKSVLIWDLTSKSLVAKLEGHHGSINSVAISIDGNLLASCAEDSRICIWRKDGALDVSIPCEHLSARVAAWSPNGQTLAIASGDGMVKLLTPSTGLSKSLIDAKMAIRKLVFSNCGRYIETDRGILDVGFVSVASISSTSMYPLRYSHALFVTQDWVSMNTEDVIWLPREYRATGVTNYGNMIVLGHLSGAISFVRLI